MPLMKENSTPAAPAAAPFQIKDYVDAVGDAATRSRGVISVLLTANFIALLAFFNALQPQYNWLSSRLKSLQTVYQWTHFPYDKDRPDKLDTLVFSSNGLPVDSPLRKHENSYTAREFDTLLRVYGPGRGIELEDTIKLPANIHLQFPKVLYDGGNSIHWERLDRNALRDALQTAPSISAYSKADLAHQISLLERARVENALLIKIPVLGIAFDVNNLALISAAAFSILFFLLQFNLARERKNLILVFHMAKDLGINKMTLYQMLSMRMVLVIPKSVDEYGRGESPTTPDFKTRLLNRLPRVPLHFSVGFWCVIFAYDIYTSTVGVTINSTLTYWQYGLCLPLGFAMFVLYLWCRAEWKNIDEVWKEEAEKIRKEMPPAPEG
jgi:hypothetical protein